ncbi:MAG: hypothetical protein OEQ53_18170, partial [Saprospiraceae bacterium]|nr:hypothetical protein [Saprospiraceae bacterium]
MARAKSDSAQCLTNKLLAIILSIPMIGSYAQTQPHPLEVSFSPYQKAQKQTPYRLEWISIGPVVNSARVESIQLDHKSPGTMYVAFGSGNLWKTVDDGISWRPIFEDLPSHGIGDIVLAPSNPEIIYVGTGESLRKQRNFTLPGNGIYRSEDGGQTWDHRGLSNNWHVGEIAVHPHEPDIVFVAAMGKFWSPCNEKGIYKSDNGGRSWKRVLYINQNTRANDIVVSPSDPDVLYASMWENNIDTTLFESVYGPNSSVYKSVNGGEDWIEINNGLPKGPRTGRIGLAVSYQNSDIAYAHVDNLNKERSKASEIYKTTDGGRSWSRTHASDLIFSSVIGWYFSDIYVNPKNHEEIFALGVRVAHSQDGGKTFKYLGGEIQHINPSAAQTLHLDHCELWIDPQNPNHLALGNDGGLYVSKDKGQNWRHFNNIPAGEFYTITISPHEPHLVYGGTQDDATVFGPVNEWKPSFQDHWKYLWIDAWSGGDGCVTQIDPDDQSLIYFSMQEGNIWKMDLTKDTAYSVRPKSKHDSIQLNYNFVTPYIISPHQGQTLYHAGNYIYKSTDGAQTWQKISPDISVSKINSKKSLAASAFAESPITAGHLYLGTDHGAFWCTEDDGNLWRENSDQLADAYIRSICPSAFDPNRLYLTMTGLDYDDHENYIYRSEDLGQTWTKLGLNLPKQPANVILEDPYFEQVLYLGMHRGVFVSLDKGETWELLGSNVPGVPVADLKIMEKNNELIIATHGRG